jgi:hypothetical protein
MAYEQHCSSGEQKNEAGMICCYPLIMPAKIDFANVEKCFYKNKSRRENFL